MRQSINEYKQSLYNFIWPSATFIAVCVILYALLLKGYLQVQSVSFLDLVIVSLASMRLVRLFCYDSVLRFLRERLAFRSEIKEEGGVGFVELAPRGVGVARVLTSLLDCVWCVSIWSTLIALILYVVSPATALLVVVLAISGVASFFQLTINLIATKYELADKKLDEKGER